MKVKELIERLSQENPEMRVVVNGYEGGYNELKNVRHIQIIPNPSKKWWYGEFEEAPDEAQAEIAILLPRTFITVDRT